MIKGQEKTAELLKSLRKVKDDSRHNWFQDLVTAFDLIETCGILHGGDESSTSTVDWIRQYLLPELEKQLKMGRELPLTEEDILDHTRANLIIPSEGPPRKGAISIKFISPLNNVHRHKHLSVIKGKVYMESRCFSSAVFEAVNSWLSTPTLSNKTTEALKNYLKTRYPYKNHDFQQDSDQKKVNTIDTQNTISLRAKSSKSIMLGQPLSESNSRMLLISAILFTLGIILGVLYLIFFS